MQAAPLIGFVTAAILVKVLAKRKHKIKKAFEVNELTEKEVKAWNEESNQGELIGRRRGEGENDDDDDDEKLVLTGGGFQRNGGTVQDSYPIDEDTWQFQLPIDDNFDVQMVAIAICMGPSQ